jgi:hypothetical protein
VTEIELHPNMKREDGVSLGRLWRLLFQSLKERNKFLSKEN